MTTDKLPPYAESELLAMAVFEIKPDPARLPHGATETTAYARTAVKLAWSHWRTCYDAHADSQSRP